MADAASSSPTPTPTPTPSSSSSSSSNQQDVALLVHNSLGGLRPFIPTNGKSVLWYACGPTVYDSAHLGHARNYLTTDLIRRVLEEYFGYDVTFVMNITDIDDKIILRARRDHLYNEYVKANPTITATVRHDVDVSYKETMQSFAQKIAEKEKEEKSAPTEPAAELVRKEKDLLVEKCTSFDANVTAALAQLKDGDAALVLLEAAREGLCVYLDKLKGAAFCDHDVIRAHASRYEEEFLEDMKTLGVRPADVLTRVSEYIPEIIDYVQTIIKNGYAYVAPSGSVYFDTHKYNGTPGHTYCKLDPQKFEVSESNLKLLAEGEGALSGTGEAKEKKNIQDFALWKASKPGEPVWESPWGLGRPGWHIECSAMASSVLGKRIDIHSGGIDLKFPHHDNEIAQAEAFYDCDEWVDVWLHPGHLDINGLKMAKSLKNFITIRQALAGERCPKFTPRQLRIMFLLGMWDKKMDFLFSTLADVKSFEKTISEFFNSANYILREKGGGEGKSVCSANQKWAAGENDLHGEFLKVQGDVDRHLRRNFNFKEAFHALLNLIRLTNGYIQKSTAPKALLIRKIASYIHRILSVFGIIDTDCSHFEFGDANADNHAAVGPYLDALTSFRSNVRELAIKKENHQSFLTACDQLRDDIMPPLGVRIMDDGAFPYALADPEQLMKEIAESRAAAARAAAEKAKKKLAALEKELDLWTKKSVDPKVMFRTDEYSQFDDMGRPTHTKDGAELSKGAKKKIEKLWSTQDKAYQGYVQKLNEDSAFVDKLRAEIQQSKQQLA